MSSKQDDEKILQAALEADTDTLFAAIGYIDARTTLGVSPSDKQSLIDRGKTSFQKHKAAINDILCNNAAVQEFFFPKDEHMKDIREAVLLISDLIYSLSGGIPVYYISVLIIKIGIREVCGNA